MTAYRERFAPLFWAAAVALGACTVDVAGAVTIGFEPPTYSPGQLVGQDGWVKNAYFGDMNGSVTVSASSPLSGAQSLAYTQTVAGGFADVSKDDVLLVQPGVSGTDVTLSYIIKATQGGFDAPNAGVFLGNGAAGGASPIFARINGGIFEVGSAGAFVPVNDFFFSPGERLKVSYEVDFDNGAMNLILENLDFGEIFSQNYPFFAPYGNPDGPNGEYRVDVAALLRGGNVQIDDITLTAGVGPLVTEYEWAATGSGNWNQANNWGPSGLPGALPGRQTAILGDAITAPATIYNNAERTLNALEIDSPHGYFLAGTGTLGFQADTSGPATVAPTLTVASGAHQIQLPVVLEDDASMTVAGGASLDLNNQIDLNGHTLTTSGTVRINHSTIGGGSVNNLGALSTSGVVSIGGNLHSAGELHVSWDESGAGSFAVDGDATLSGILDVSWDPTSAPAGTVTVLSAGGSLDASGLQLAANDAAAFALGTEGNNLTLTFLGVAVPEPTAIGMLLMGLAASAWRRGKRQAVLLVPFLCLTALTAGFSNVTAASVDFEEPAYTTGAVVGQQAWVTNAYVLADPFFGGAINGDVVISTAGPLAGGQSLLYSQTSVPAGAGGTGASDVGFPDFITAKEDGSSAIDLTASWLLSADVNPSGNGSVGLFLGEGGRSPILILISGANSGAGTGSILVGHDGVLPSYGSFTAGNVYEFTIGVDLDGQNYEATARDVTAGTAAVTLVGPAAGGRFPFFGGSYPDNGDGMTYTFDASLMLRSGAGRIDNINAVAIPEPHSLALAVFGVAGSLILRKRRIALPALLAVGLAAIAATPQRASAIAYTFEPPTYASGPLQGQDNWITAPFIFADPFFGGVVNGTVDVSTTNPLSGAQSVHYNQTVDPPAAGGTGGSDVARPFSVFAVKDGASTVDITASALINGNSNSVGNGQMGFFLGRGGRSPVLILLNNLNSSGGTGEILVGHEGGLPSAGAFTAGDTYEVSIGVDLDNQNYEVFTRNVTAGTPSTKLNGPGPDGRFNFFGGAFGDDGDGNTFTFDTSIMLRSGAGRFDNFTAVGEDFTEAVWAGGSGSWSQNTAWIPQMIPNIAATTANAPVAVFGDRITSPQTVFTATTQTVNGLRFDSEEKYAIGGNGTIALRANTVGGVVNPSIEVLTGSHEMQAAVSILNDTDVTVSNGAALDFNNTVSLGGRTLSTSGEINLNVGVTGGGAISSAGILGTAGDTPIAANLTSTGTLRIDLGPANTDRFTVTGNATLSGMLDVVLEPGFIPAGAYTVLSTTGSLNATGLALDPSDAGQFSLSVVGNNLQLTVGGAGLPGDFNNDGMVDGSDLNLWKGAFGQGPGADADDDGDSDGADFLIWQRNVGQQSAGSSTGAVPEPAGLALFVAAAVAFGISSRRRARL